MFVYQCIILNLFCGFLENFMGFILYLKTKFFSPKIFLPGSGGQPFRSTEPGAGRPERSTGRAQGCVLGRVSWPVDRLKATHSRVAPVDRAVDRPKSRCSLVLGTVDRQAQRSNFDRWPIDRPVDRMVKSDHNWLPTASFLCYINPICGLFCVSFQEPKFQSFSTVFTSFKKSFRASKI